MSIFIIPRKSKWCGEVHEVFIKKQETMIPTKELMLGNWVYNNDVQCIPMTVTLIEDGHVYLDFPGNDGDPIDGYEEDIMPILLTGHFLEQNRFHVRSLCGYSNHFQYDYYGKFNFTLTAIENSDFSVLICGAALKVKYVHQLQNLMRVIGIDANFKM